MRRLIAIAPITLALVFPAGASARDVAYEGRGVDDPEARFRFVLRDKRKITRFVGQNAMIECSNGDELRSGKVTMRSGIRVTRRGRFEDTQSNVNSRARVRGKIDGRRARGEWRYSGTFDEGECDTGWVPWRARR